MKHLTKKTLLPIIMASTATLLSQNALADWSLDDQNSSVNFVSIKNSTITEVNHFNQLSGTVADDGKVNVSIDLTSVDTNIEVRDQRLRDMLFHVEKYPEAKLSTSLDISQVSGLKAGESKVIPIDLSLSLHNKTQNIPTKVTVVGLADGSLQVTTTEPVIVNTSQFDLVDGVKALQDIAKLNAIAFGVPVTAQFVFNQQ